MWARPMAKCSWTSAFEARTRSPIAVPACPACARAIVNGIAVDPSDPNTAYVMLGGTAGHLFRTTDGGMTWTDVDNNLPDFPTYSMVIDPETSPSAPNGTVYVGTQVGVYMSTNNGASWSRFGNGMPNVPVRDLQFSQNYEELVAGTLGRGVFMISTQHNGPRVVSESPANPASPGLSSITVTFDHPVDPRTFTPANIQSLTGPDGPITVLAVNDIDPVNHERFQITFLPQITDGIYGLTIAPTVEDFLGNQMDQSGNGLNGAVAMASAPALSSTARTTAPWSPACTMTCCRTSRQQWLRRLHRYHRPDALLSLAADRAGVPDFERGPRRFDLQ